MSDKPKFNPNQPFQAVGKPKFDPNASFSAVEDEDPTLDPATAAASGLIQGGTLGFGDEIGAAGKAAMNAITGVTGPLGGGSLSDIGEDYARNRDQLRSEFQKSAQANPKTALAANIAGSIANPINTMIPNVSAGKGLGSAIANAGTQGAAVGAVQGVGSSDSNNIGGIARDAALSTGVGALGGGVGGALAYGAEKAAPVVGKWLGNKAEDLSAKAQGLERGTLNKMGIDRARAVGRQGLDEGVVGWMPAGTDTMIARNESLMNRAGDARNAVYNAVDEAGASGFNPLNVATDVENKLSPTYRTPINKGEWSQLDNTIESILARGEGNIPLTEAQALKEEIGAVAYPGGKKPAFPTPKQEMAQGAYRIVNKSLDRAAESGASALGTEGLDKTIQGANRTMSTGYDARNILGQKQARELGNKTFGLTDWSILGPSAAAAPFTHGVSLLGIPIVLGKKFGEKYGAQIGAKAINSLGDLVSKAPQALGKYAGPLTNAASRGGSALNAAHFVLQQTDEGYRNMIKQLQGDDAQDAGR